MGGDRQLTFTSALEPGVASNARAVDAVVDLAGEARTSAGAASRMRGSRSAGTGMRANGMTFEPPMGPSTTRPTAVFVAAPTMRGT